MTYVAYGPGTVLRACEAFVLYAGPWVPSDHPLAKEYNTSIAPVDRDELVTVLAVYNTRIVVATPNKFTNMLLLLSRDAPVVGWSSVNLKFVSIGAEI